MNSYIPLTECQNNGLYEIVSRNLCLGVYVESMKGFIGVREKFGEKYLFTEFHYDTGAPLGTVYPKKLLEICPIVPINEGRVEENSFKINEPLFHWLIEKENGIVDRRNTTLPEGAK